MSTEHAFFFSILDGRKTKVGLQSLNQDAHKGTMRRYIWLENEADVRWSFEALTSGEKKKSFLWIFHE